MGSDDLSASGAAEWFNHWSFIIQMVSSLKNSNVRPIGTQGRFQEESLLPTPRSESSSAFSGLVNSGGSWFQEVGPNKQGNGLVWTSIISHGNNNFSNRIFLDAHWYTNYTGKRPQIVWGLGSQCTRYKQQSLWNSDRWVRHDCNCSSRTLCSLCRSRYRGRHKIFIQELPMSIPGKFSYKHHCRASSRS